MTLSYLAKYSVIRSILQSDINLIQFRVTYSHPRLHYMYIACPLPPFRVIQTGLTELLSIWLGPADPRNSGGLSCGLQYITHWSVKLSWLSGQDHETEM